MSRPRHPLRDALFAHILAGGTPKEFTSPSGVRGFSQPHANKMANNMGLKKYFLTDDEFAQVMAQRRSKGVAA